MTHLRFTFRFQKALEASAFILRLAGGQMGYIDLLKMLYIADRECLAVEGDTITGDSVKARKRGPVLRTIFNLIQKNDSQSERWHSFIGARFNHNMKQLEVFIKESPGDGDLYQFEKEILLRVFEEHKDKDLVSYTHTFPEWRKYESILNSANKSQCSITIEDMLEGIGKPELIDIVKENIAAEKFHSKLFRR